jgi:hypothetical protein
MFLFFCSLFGGNRHGIKNIEKLIKKNFNVLQNGNLSVQGSILNPYEEQLVQQWISDDWMSTQRNTTTIDTTKWFMSVITELNIAPAGWMVLSKTEYQFKRIEETLGFSQLKMYSFSESEWVLVQQIDFTYDSNDFVTQIDGQIDFGMGLMPYSKNTFSNNSAGLPLTETIENFNFATSTLEKTTQYTYTYNGSNPKDLVTEKESYWNSTQWVDTLQTVYTRNAELLPLTKTDQLFTNPATLQNLYRYVYTYDGSNLNVTEENSEYWDNNSNNWTESTKTIYTYTSTEEVNTVLYQQYYNSSWMDISRTTNYYDALDNITREFTESYFGTSWANQMQVLYSYIPTDVEDKEISVNSFSLFNNYPNPFNPSTTISYELATGSFVTLKVYDILGNEIATLVNEFKPAGNYQTWFDGKNSSNNQLASGTYLYRLQANGNSITKKMILLK